MKELTQEYLKKRIYYDPQTGVFTWLPIPIRPRYRRFDLAWNTKYSEKQAGCVRKSRYQLAYIKISIHKKPFQGHRLAFLYMTGKFPPEGVDHKDGNGLNNRWENLRPATQSQNTRNRRINSNNTSGFKGVYLDKRDGRYDARITICGETHNLGRFSNPQDAHNVYVAAAKKHFGEFARYL